jgi:hypothetical protein
MEKTMEEVGAITRHNSKNIQHVMTEIEGSRKLMVEMLAMLTGGKRTIAVPTKKVLQAGTSGLQKGRIEENSMQSMRTEGRGTEGLSQHWVVHQPCPIQGWAFRR